MASLDIGQASLCFKIVSTSLDKQRVLSMLLHSCDVSHPAKMWQLHSQWTTRLVTLTILTMSIDHPYDDDHDCYEDHDDHGDGHWRK